MRWEFFTLALPFLIACGAGPSGVPGLPGVPKPRGDSFNNGGGAAEQNLVFVWEQRREWLATARRLSVAASPREKQLLEKIAKLEGPEPRLYFASRQKSPERFTGIAVTPFLVTRAEPGAELTI